MSPNGAPMSTEAVSLTSTGMVDLAPEIYRQRLVVEGLVTEPISAAQIEDYLSQLSVVVDMVTLIRPVTHQSDKYGWAGWIHWETSGAHFYGWDEPRLFFSVDIYTCKAFSAQRAVEFTRDYFNATRVEYREF
jgi:S-adenosylmethionine/arginine decarboxylase-like enzyme